jgi:hypothetical protein
LPLVHSPMSLQNDTSNSEPWSTHDPAPLLSVNKPCLTQSRRRLKMIIQEKQNGQPRDELTLQPEKQTFGSNLLNLPPVVCSNTSSKLTATPRAHPKTSFLDATQWRNSNSTFSTVKTYPRSNSSKKSKLIASLVASPSILSSPTVYYWQSRRRIPWETMLQPSTVSSSRPSQMLT